MTDYLAPRAGAGITTDLGVPARALAIGAHPDDIDFGCGGTLAKWSAGGTEVHLLVLTDGSKGTWDPNADIQSLIRLRQAEQRAAAACLGAAGVTFLHNVDGELESGLDQRATVCRVIRERRPDVVLGHDPWKRYRLHPDHRHAGHLATEGIVAARDPHFFRDQGLPPHRPGCLLLWEADIVDHLESVQAWLDTKVQALLCHESQWESTMTITSEPNLQRQAFIKRIHASAREAGAGANLAQAEPFKRIDRL